MASQKPIDPQDLPRNFNLVSTELDPATEYGRHFRHANYWTERIFKMSFFLNIGTIIFLTIGMIAFLLKPEPAIYGTTEFGSLYPLTGVSKSEAISLINQHQAQLNANNANNPPNASNSETQTPQSNTANNITANQIIKNSNDSVSTVPVIPGNLTQPEELPTPTIQAPLSDLSKNAQPTAPVAPEAKTTN